MFLLIFCSLCTQTFARVTSIYVTICIPLYYSHNVCVRDFKNFSECANAHSIEGTLVAALYHCRRRVFPPKKSIRPCSQYVIQYDEKLALFHLSFLAFTNKRHFSKKRNRQNNVKLNNLQSEINIFFFFFLLFSPNHYDDKRVTFVDTQS